MTAVEWLRKELETIPNYSAFYTNNYTWIDSIMNEAKEMEKQQIIESYCQGCFDIIEDECIFPRETAEEYYNETFKNTNK